MCNLFNQNQDMLKEKYAHTRKNDNNIIEKEPYLEHSQKTKNYYEKIVENFSLKNIFKKLLNEMDFNNEEQEKILCYLKEFILNHDIGKLSEDFQQKLNGENNNATHSDLSYYLLLYKLLDKNQNNEINGKLFILLFLTLYSVYKHHGKLNNLFEDISKKIIPDNNKIKRLKTILENVLKEQVDEKIINTIKKNEFWQRWEHSQEKNLIRKLSKNSLSLFTFLKLFHSLLISSDFYATSEFKIGNNNFDFKILDGTLKTNMRKNFFEKYKLNDWLNFNKDIEDKKEELKNKSISNSTDINEVRSIINVKAEESVEEVFKQENHNKVFMLSIPTGGGKTNLSLRLALKIMEKEGNIKKLFYVFPFINIIEQSYEFIERFVGKDNITRLDSRFIDISNTEDQDYDKNKIYSRYIDNLFFNKPVLMMSHVKFFDLFFRNDKNNNYNFYQLANSIVIIDEIQAYKDLLWTEVATLIDYISKTMNIYFIIMSATLPQIDELISNIDEKPNFTRIFDKKLEKEIFNNNVFKRVTIKFDNKIKIEMKKQENEKWKKIKNKIIKATENKNKVLVVLNKVKDSYEIFNILKKEKELENFEIYLLNSTILDFRRKEIIKNCKEKEKVILISTQSVEAGVDLDFDIGFRAYAPLDSIVQVAGRVNRNNKKQDSTLTVFKDEGYQNIYRKKVSVKNFITSLKENELFKNNSELNEYNDIQIFYEKSIKEIKNQNDNPFIESSFTNINDMINLYYGFIDKNIHLIDGDTISLFIPIELETSNLPDDIKKLFSDFIEQNKISGLKVWETYKKLFEEERAFENLIIIREFRKKLLPFTINIFNTWIEKMKLNDLIKYEMEYGFYFCEDWKKYYSLDTGLNIDNFKKEIKIKGIFI